MSTTNRVDVSQTGKTYQYMKHIRGVSGAALCHYDHRLRARPARRFYGFRDWLSQSCAIACMYVLLFRLRIK